MNYNDHGDVYGLEGMMKRKEISGVMPLYFGSIVPLISGMPGRG